jgi:protein transport protein SEC20
MASQSLSARLQALADTYKNTLTLIQRLQKLPATPGSFSTSDSEDPRLELSSEVHQSLKDQEDELETLRQEVQDSTANFLGGYVGGGSVRRRNSEQVHERERIAAMVAKLGEDLKM